RQPRARACSSGIADLHDLLIRDVRNQTDALGRVDAQVPAEPAGEVEDLDLVEVNAVILEDDLQAGDIGALRLRQLVHIALEEKNLVLLVDGDAMPPPS